MWAPSRHSHSPALGFTLIEILIAMLILAFMATMTAISIQRSIKIKSKLEKEIDDDSQLREAVAMMTRDINLAFHWVDPLETIKNQISADAKAKNQANPFPTPSPGTGPTVPTEEVTYFMGDGNSIYFTTLSNERKLKDSPESDQAKIGYYLKTVHSFKDNKNVQSLMRSVGTYLDGDYRAPGKESVLMENVKDLKFRFLPDDAKDNDMRVIDDSTWLDSWKTLESSDTKTKNRFPAAVEISLTIERDGRTTTLKTIASIHTTNNDPFKFATPSPTGTPGPGGTPAPSPLPTQH